MTEDNEALSRSIRRHLLGAGLSLCLLLAFLFFWFALMDISGAVVASGRLMVESDVKTVKHKEGGIVAEIFVEDGDTVDAGQLLVLLDNTVAKANLAVVTKQLDERLASEARLKAERDGKDTIDFPVALTDRENDPEIAAILDGQRRLLKARQASLAGRTDQLKEQVKQLESQNEGLRIQAAAKKEEIGLISRELAGLESLLEDSYVSTNRVYATRREKTRLSGEYGSLLSKISGNRLQISERDVLMLKAVEDYRAQVLKELEQTTSEIAELSERNVAAEDLLERMDIVSPRKGVVHQLAVHAKGGVISPSEQIMLIVPNEDPLIIKARVSPNDIDQIYPGQTALIRLPGLSRRTTPELNGIVTTVAAETTRDEITGADYFEVRIQLRKGEDERIKDAVLIAGMPTEAMIRTGDRSILSYLIKPLSDQITLSFREQ